MVAEIEQQCKITATAVHTTGTKIIGFSFVGSMCKCDATTALGGVYYAKITHGYHLSHIISYNLYLSNLIGTDYLYDCTAWWLKPS